MIPEVLTIRQQIGRALDGMDLMSAASIERRVAPRFSVKCTGELASGSSAVEVTVSDMSVTGCGIEIEDVAADALGRTGVLSIRLADGAGAPVMLPVVVSNHRVTGDRARLGLQFRRLDMAQMRSLIGVLDGMIDR